MIEHSLLILLVILSIIFLTPSLCRLLHIPSIVGLILAGMAIGPFGLRLFTSSHTFEIIGQLGMLYIMFQSGSEIDLNDVRTNRLKCLFFGLSTFFFPAVLGMLAGHYLFHFSKVPSILFGAMLGSHTLMTYPIVSRYGVQDYDTVNISVGATLIAIFLSLVVLIGVKLQCDAGNSSWAFVALKIVAYLFFVGWILPPFVRWFFKKNPDVIVQFMFVLVLIVFCAYLASVVDLEGILGAFVCGVALNRLIPNRSSLMNRVNFMGNSLFVPLFLLSVGMMIDIRAFFAGEYVILLAIAMIIAKLSGKWLAAFVTQNVFGMKKLDRLLMFGLTQATAAGTLAIVTIGYKIGIFTSEVLNSAVIMILLLCTLSSFITEYAAKRIALQEEPTMPIDRDVDAWMLVSIGKKIYTSLNEIAMLSSLHDTEIVATDTWETALKKAERSNKSILIYHEMQPLNAIRRLFVFVPQYAEKERDFITCFGQLRRLSAQIGVRVTFYCFEQTEKIIRALAMRKNKIWHVAFKRISTWDILPKIAQEMQQDDMFSMITARKSTPSYDPRFAELPKIIDSAFQKFSYMVLYPEQSIGGKVVDNFLTETLPTSTSWSLLSKIKGKVLKVWEKIKWR